MEKLKGFFKLLRFELPFSAGVCVIMGQLLALGKFASISVTLYSFLSVFFISASILILNDYFDVETDKINAPERPIPANLVTKTEALFLSLILIILGLILSFLLSATAMIVAIVLLIIGYLYNHKFKKSGLTGNLMVSFSVGMTFIYGGVSVGLAFNKIVWFFALIAALIDLGEEIAADAMDMQGDTLINSNSLAIKYGKQKAIKISTSIFFFVVLISIFPFIMHWFQGIYLIPITIMDIAIAYPALKLLKSKNQEGRKHIRQIYLGATLGLISFILMRFFGV